MPKREDPMDRLARLARLERLRTSGEARAIRRSANVSANELAKRIGTSANSVLRWEEGLSAPRPEAALRWLAALEAMRAELDKSQEEGSTLAAAAAAG